MGANKDFYGTLRAGRCSFFLADLHVHSPASFDIRTGKRFETLSEKTKTALATIPAALSENFIEYEKQVLKAVPPDDFLADLVSQRDHLLQDLQTDVGLDWALVAITDHNICEYSCAVASAAFKSRSSNKLVVLPGIEVDIIYRCPETNVDSQIHVLCIFQPDTTALQLQFAMRDNLGNSWGPGLPARVESLPECIQKLRHHAQSPAICIAAHVGSGKGVQRETKNAILNHLDAELSRLEGEKQSGKHPDLEAIGKQIEALEKKRNPESISLDVLRLIGNCGFDALQVTSTGDAVHYRRLHRFKDDHGRASPIVASDAHRVDDVFRAGKYFPHLKLPPLSTARTAAEIFGDVRRSLRHGETRFSASAPSPAQFWISGIEITPDSREASRFFPSNSADLNSFVLPLSRNLNTLIGGRGSGKSSTIEALAFICEPALFSQSGSSRSESYTRAEATLSGCRVKLCFQFMGGILPSALPKRCMFAQRYFDPKHQHQNVEYTNLDDSQLVPQQIPPHPVQIFRLGEIEKQAGPEKLRALFDRICGPDIVTIADEITAIKQKLKLQRRDLVQLANKIRELTQEGSPLRDFASRQFLYDAVNTAEVKAAYEEIDELELYSASTERLNKIFSSSLGEEEVNHLADRISKFFEEARSILNTLDRDKSRKLDSLFELFASADDKEGSADQKRLNEITSQLRQSSSAIKLQIDAAKLKFREELIRAKNALTEKGLPIGSKDREAKKLALNEAETALARYRELVKEWDDTHDQRRELRGSLVRLNERRSKLRHGTGESITRRLRADLDERIIRIEADAQLGTDRDVFRQWLTMNCRGGDFKFQVPRIESLISSSLTPDRLRQLLMSDPSVDHNILVVPQKSAADGDMDEKNAKSIIAKCLAMSATLPELVPGSASVEFATGLPAEVRAGFRWFPGEDTAHTLDQALTLDEIAFDDTPVIRLNDRPLDPKSKARPVEELSPGQRCSAVLPILLLTGDFPLIIDQPEDNLDNRLIRQVIVNILASIKLRRQVIIATHNPNLPVLGDVESAVILQGVGDRQCEIINTGDLDSPDLAHHLTEVMEGGREAFQYRHTIYANHWTGPVTDR